MCRYLVEDDLGMLTVSEDPEEIRKARYEGKLYEEDDLGMTTLAQEEDE